MSDTVEATQLEALRQAVNGLKNTHQAESRARDSGLRDVERAWDFWAKNEPELAAAAKKAFDERFEAVDQGFEELHVQLAGMIDNAIQVTVLRAENQRLTAQLAEVADFRARVREFLQVE